MPKRELDTTEMRLLGSSQEFLKPPGVYGRAQLPELFQGKLTIPWCIWNPITELVLFGEGNWQDRLRNASDHELFRKICDVRGKRRETVSSDTVGITHEGASACSKFQTSADDVEAAMPYACL